MSTNIQSIQNFIFSPTVPTLAVGTNTLQSASTAFVTSAILPQLLTGYVLPTSSPGVLATTNNVLSAFQSLQYQINGLAAPTFQTVTTASAGSTTANASTTNAITIGGILTASSTASFNGLATFNNGISSRSVSVYGGGAISVAAGGSVTSPYMALTPSSVPTGANGLFYYDSTSNLFQFYQNGAYVGLSATPFNGIKNQTTVQTGASFNIDGAGILGGSLTISGGQPTLYLTASGVNVASYFTTAGNINAYADLHVASGKFFWRDLNGNTLGTLDSNANATFVASVASSQLLVQSSGTNSLQIGNSGSVAVFNNLLTGYGFKFGNAAGGTVMTIDNAGNGVFTLSGSFGGATITGVPLAAYTAAEGLRLTTSSAVSGGSNYQSFYRSSTLMASMGYTSTTDQFYINTYIGSITLNSYDGNIYLGNTNYIVASNEGRINWNCKISGGGTSKTVISAGYIGAMYYDITSSTGGVWHFSGTAASQTAGTVISTTSIPDLLTIDKSGNGVFANNLTAAGLIISPTIASLLNNAGSLNIQLYTASKSFNFLNSSGTSITSIDSSGNTVHTGEIQSSGYRGATTLITPGSTATTYNCTKNDETIIVNGTGTAVVTIILTDAALSGKRFTIIRATGFTGTITVKDPYTNYLETTGGGYATSVNIAAAGSAGCRMTWEGRSGIGYVLISSF